MDAVKIQSLITVVNLPGYATILEIFAAKVNELEREVFNIDPADTTRIIAAARVAVGAKWILQQTIKEITQLTAPAKEPQPQMTREEYDALYLKSLGVNDGNRSESAGRNPAR